MGTGRYYHWGEEKRPELETDDPLQTRMSSFISIPSIGSRNMLLRHKGNLFTLYPTCSNTFSASARLDKTNTRCL